MAAEKEGRKIAVEVKSFTGHSEMNDLEKAVGQYIVYHDVLSSYGPQYRMRPTSFKLNL